MKRYSIMVIEHGWPRERELCQCDTNPEEIVAAAREKTVRINAGHKMAILPKFTAIRIIDREKAE